MIDEHSVQYRVEVFADDADRRRRVVATDRRIDGQLWVAEIDGGVILPLRDSTERRYLWQGGVLDRNRNYVAGHHVHPDRYHNRNIVSGYEPGLDIRRLPETVVYGGGSGAMHFGHFLTETLSRLWWIVAHPENNYRIVLNTRGLRPDSALMQLVTLLGIPADRVLILNEPTQFDTVIVPEQAYYLRSGAFHPDGMRLVFDTIRSNVPQGANDSVYLTRTALRTSPGHLHELNEEFFEAFYTERGYDVVAPETLSIPDQISLLSGARRLASTSGTLSHLALFSPEGVIQDVLLRTTGSFKLMAQWGISQFRSASLAVVDATESPLPGSHWAGVTAFGPTTHWRAFAAQRFGVDVPAGSMPADRLLDLITLWTELLSTASAKELNLIPSWTVADFVASFHRTLSGSSLDDETIGRLGRRFDSAIVPASSGSVSVSFSTSGGSAVPTTTVPYGRVVACPTDPHRDGHSFSGWFTSPRLKTRYDFDAPVTGDRTIHAKWAPESVE